MHDHNSSSTRNCLNFLDIGDRTFMLCFIKLTFNFIQMSIFITKAYSKYHNYYH